MLESPWVARVATFRAVSVEESATALEEVATTEETENVAGVAAIAA